MNRAISGFVSVSGSGRPLQGVRVVAARVEGGRAEILGESMSGDFGRFRVTYDPVPGPADLTVLIFSPEGRLIFTEPIHRLVCGAELCIRVEVPRTFDADPLH